MDMFTNILQDTAVNAIVRTMQDSPQKWRWKSVNSRDEIEHTESMIVIYCYSGEYSISKPTKIKLNWKNWFKLRRAVKRWKKTLGNSQIRGSDIKTLTYISEILK